jgi:hypothetical protein
MGIDG